MYYIIQQEIINLNLAVITKSEPATNSRSAYFGSDDYRIHVRENDSTKNFVFETKEERDEEFNKLIKALEKKNMLIK